VGSTYVTTAVLFVCLVAQADSPVAVRDDFQRQVAMSPVVMVISKPIYYRSAVNPSRRMFAHAVFGGSSLLAMLT